MFLPQGMLNRLYTQGSLQIDQGILRFQLKNRLKHTVVRYVSSVSVNKRPLEPMQIRVLNNSRRPITNLAQDDGALPLALGDTLTFELMDAAHLLNSDDSHQYLSISFCLETFGEVTVYAEDALTSDTDHTAQLPRQPGEDLTSQIIAERHAFVRHHTGSDPQTLFGYQGDTHHLEGNIEHFVGMAQVPVGVAGPLKVNGEHAHDTFWVPLATTEGTLVASYNRGMKLIYECGGAEVTVVEEAMQRAPVFIFDSARAARAFVDWVKAHQTEIGKEAESTDKYAKLRDIDAYQSNKFAFLRFNFHTGDAAGQNMVGQATYAACNWLLSQYPAIKHFYLESNMATDKKASQINILKTRGKRVTAEVTLPRKKLMEIMHVTPEQMDYHARVSGVGAFMAGVNNTGLHAANGITAMFIATGQDVANVAESSTGIFYSEITAEGDLYLSLTLPSLIVATHGGGTGLRTQQDCLSMLGCTGPGTSLKLAEIVAATALAGEISLASAISSLDWVTSHEEYGRNR